MLETEVLAGLDHPLLTLVSPVFLEHGLAAYQLLRRGGLSPERREHLRRLWEQGHPPDGNGAGSESP